MKVYKVADIINNEVVFCVARAWKQGDVIKFLTNLEPARATVRNTLGILKFKLPRDLRNEILIDINPLLNIDDSLDGPLLLADNRLVFYRDRLFMAERVARSVADREEIILRTENDFEKKRIFHS